MPEHRSAAASGSTRPATTGTNLQYQAKATHIFGGHQIRTACLYEDIEYDNINQRTGPTFTLPDGQQTATGATRSTSLRPDVRPIYRVTRANFNSGREHDADY